MEVLRQFGRRPVAGAQLTLLSRHADTPYSGMLPGVVAGHYTRRESHIDLLPLVRSAGGTFVIDEAIGLDLDRRLVRRHHGPPIRWDVLSIDIGSTPDTGGVPLSPGAVCVKPIDGFLARWQDLLGKLGDERHPRRLAVIGGGAAGVELVLAMQFRASALVSRWGLEPHHLQFALFSSAPDILPGYPASVRRRFLRVLSERHVEVHLGQSVTAVEAGAIVTADARHVVDHVVWATSARAAAWIGSSGLAVDAKGFMRIAETLESVSHPGVFGAGDVATMDGHPRPKSGVFAVRQGPPLARNLRAALEGSALTAYQPQVHALSLITTGDKHAVASRGSWVTSGAWVWRWKDWIDRRFMRRYRGYDGCLVGG